MRNRELLNIANQECALTTGKTYSKVFSPNAYIALTFKIHPMVIFLIAVLSYCVDLLDIQVAANCPQKGRKCSEIIIKVWCYYKRKVVRIKKKWNFPCCQKRRLPPPTLFLEYFLEKPGICKSSLCPFYMYVNLLKG